MVVVVVLLILHACMFVREVCVCVCYIHTVCGARGRCPVPFFITNDFIPSRHGLSLTLKLGWQPESPRDPPASAHTHTSRAGVASTYSHAGLVCKAAGIPSRALMFTQQVFPPKEPSLLLPRCLLLSRYGFLPG